MSAPWACISPSREVYTTEPDGRRVDHTLGDTPIVWGGWDVQGASSAAFSWPTWSPDGGQVACFRLPGDNQPNAAVFVLDRDGVQATELVDLGAKLPIYLFWSPDGDRLAILSQANGSLELSVVSPRELGVERTLAAGSPLFFTWAERRLATFVGGTKGGARLVLLDPRRGARDTVLPGRPGSFCAPVWLSDTVIFVDETAGKTHLVSARDGDAEVRVLEPVEGLVAMLASPAGTLIARGSAPGGDGSPYRRLGLVDVATGDIRELADLPCLAFFWVPTGDALIVVRVNTDDNLLEWIWLGVDGTQRHLCNLYPTRDLGFYLRFFEQYAQSHPLVDPSGQHLLLAGNLAGAQGPDDDPRIWRVSLEDGHTKDMGPGVFAVYGPAR